MPLDSTPHPRPLRGAAVAYCTLAVGIAALGLAACTSPKAEVIARYPTDSGPDTGAEPDASTSEAGASGAGGAAVPLPISPTRGRVKVVAGTLLSDVNTPLRGLLLPVDTGWSLSDFDLQTITTYAQSMGLNTIHVYAEDSGQITGAMEAEVDALVAQAGRVGMYVIIGVGTGTNVGTFDLAKLNEFWPRYAAHFASQPHVLFEIQNNPDMACSIAAKTFDMEHAIYKIIRAAAPDSHILLLSTQNLLKASVLTDAITNLSTDVDWSNASIDMDINPSTPCLPLGSLAELTAAAQARGVALLIGQLPPTGWGPYLTAFEQAKLGWMQYTFFADPAMRSVDSYVSAIESAGVTWCPDQGTFPQDSRTCH